MKKVFNVNILTFKSNVVLWPEPAKILAWSHCPAMILSVLQIFLLIPNIHGGWVGQVFKPSTKVNDAAVDEAIQELQSQTGDVIVKGDPVRVNKTTQLDKFVFPFRTMTPEN